MQFKVLMGNLSEGDSIGINKQPEMVQVMKLFRETDTDGASPPETRPTRAHDDSRQPRVRWNLRRPRAAERVPSAVAAALLCAGSGEIDKFEFKAIATKLLQEKQQATLAAFAGGALVAGAAEYVAIAQGVLPAPTGLF